MLSRRLLREPSLAIFGTCTVARRNSSGALAVNMDMLSVAMLWKGQCIVMPFLPLRDGGGSRFESSAAPLLLLRFPELF